MASEPGPGQCLIKVNANRMGNRAIAGDSPVAVKLDEDSSRAGHVQSCLNMGGPSSKPKYYLMTDSEQVPRGKGEKNPEQGSEIDLKSNTYNQS